MDSPPQELETSETPMAPAPAWLAVSRGVALFLGTLAWLNLLGDFRQAGPVATLWSMDGVTVARPMARAGLSLAAMLLIGFAVAPRFPLPVRLLTICGLLMIFALALERTFQHYRLINQQPQATRILVPLSLQMAGYLATVLAGLFAGRRVVERPWRDGFVAAMAVCVCLAGFPLAQMQCVGACEPTATADNIVIMGFRNDRQNLTNGELQQHMHVAQTLAQRTDSVSNIVLCRNGIQPEHNESADEPSEKSSSEIHVLECQSLAGSIESTIQWANEKNLRRLTIVGDAYSLPRTKLRFQQAGFAVRAIPIAPTSGLSVRWRHLVHEAAALWWWYLRPLG